MQKKHSLFVIGSIAYDEKLIFNDRFSKYLGSKNLNASFVVDKKIKNIGGIALNISYAFKMCAGDTCYPVSSVGLDGDEVLKWLEQNGISANFVAKAKDQLTGVGISINDSDQNQLWAYYYGANECFSDKALSKILDSDLAILSATHKNAFLSWQSALIKKGIKYVYDPGMTLSWIDDRSLLEGIKGSIITVANEGEWAQIEQRLKCTAKDFSKDVICIVTLGSKGVEWFKNGSKQFLKSYKIENVIDPTGAGDTFRGGLAYAIMNNKDICESVAFGSALTSIKLEGDSGLKYAVNKSELSRRVGVLLGHSKK